MSEYDDGESWDLFGINYRGTRRQANSIYQRLQKTPEHRRYVEVVTLLESVYFNADDCDSWQKATDLATEKADLQRKVTTIASVLVDQEIGEVCE